MSLLSSKTNFGWDKRKTYL